MSSYVSNITEALKAEYATFQSIIGPIRLTKSQLLGLFIRKLAHDAKIEWEDASLTLRTAVAGMAVVVIMVLVDKSVAKLGLRRTKLGIPVLQRPKGVHLWDYENLLQEGHRQYPDTPYIITYSGYEYIVYPSSSFDEVKRLSMSHASLVDWATHVFFQGWRLLGKDNSILHKVIAADLFRALPSSVHARQRNAKDAVKTAIGDCEDWKSVRLYFTVQDMVARTNAASFMGRNLGTSRRWLWPVHLLPMVSMVAVFICHSTPKMLRPLVALFVFFPAWCIYWFLEFMARPMVRREMAEFEVAARSGEELSSTRGDGMGDTGKFPITAWLMARYPPEQRTARQIGRDFINIAFESTTATSATLYFVLAELAGQPDLVEEVRDELLSNMDEQGKLPQTNLIELQKLDSIMRESSRINTFSYCTSPLLCVIRLIDSKPCDTDAFPWHSGIEQKSLAARQALQGSRTATRLVDMRRCISSRHVCRALDRSDGV